jgi:cytochrome c biogenesis protein CcmG/thiol:disulfide interchange protein DsbE
VTVGERPAAGPTADEAAPDAPPSRAARWSAVVVGLVVLGLLVVFVKGLGDDDEVSSSPLDGKVAPELVGTTLDGAPLDLARYRGSWVVVNFFATWCPPCVQEHPELVRFSEEHQAAGDRLLVSVVFNDAPASVRRFFDEQGGEWPVLVDEGGAAAVDWAVAQVPESVLVAPNGVVVGKLKGGVRAEDLDRVIDDIERQAAGR